MGMGSVHQDPPQKKESEGLNTGRATAWSMVREERPGMCPCVHVYMLMCMCAYGDARTENCEARAHRSITANTDYFGLTALYTS
jgi:hypothetical protein